MVSQYSNDSSISSDGFSYVLDTGTSHHVTIDPTTLTVSLPYSRLEGITSGNGETTPICSVDRRFF